MPQKIGTFLLSAMPAHRRVVATAATLAFEKAQIATEKAKLDSEIVALGARTMMLGDELATLKTKMASTDAALAELRAIAQKLKIELGESQAKLRKSEAALDDTRRREELALEEVWAYKTVVRSLKRSHPADIARVTPSEYAAADPNSALRQRIEDLEAYLHLGGRTIEASADQDQTMSRLTDVVTSDQH